MKTLFLLPLFLMAGLGLNAQMAHGPQSDDLFPVLSIQTQAVLDSLVQWEERLYLHMDRKTARPGEALFFKGYAMTGPNRYRVSPSGVLKVDLLDSEGNLVRTQYYRLRNGMAEGAIQIPAILEPDTYTLQAYTRWMQNYGKQQIFKQQIRVAENLKDPEPGSEMAVVASVSFYPEGGKLLAGLNNKLIIRALDTLGHPVALDGVIETREGERINKVESYETGLGMSMLKPRAGTFYVLKLANGESYPLPEVADSGYSLQVNPLDPDHIRITVASVGMKDEHLKLAGVAGGKTCFEQDLKFQGRNKLQLNIPKEKMPVGLMKFTLSDLRGELLVERPVRLEGPEALQLKLVPIRTNLNEGGSNTFRLQALNADGEPVQADISLSVAADYDLETQGISEYMRVNPGTADTGRFRKALFLDDLNALGADPQLNTRAFPNEIVFPIQKSLELIGYAYDLNNELLRNTPIQVMSSTEDDLFIAEVTTDRSGILKVSGIEFAGEIPLIFRTRGEDTPSSLVRFEALHDEIYEKENFAAIQRPIPQKKSRGKETVETTPWAVIDTTGLIRLAEATVTANKHEVQETPSVYGIEPRRVIRQDPKKPANNIGELLQRMPGVFVSGDIFTSPSIRIPSAPPGPVRWVVDGLLLVANRNPFDLIPIIDIERIELLSASDNSIYGSRGSGAILAIYTRNGSGANYVRRKDAMVTFKGFEAGLSFEAYLEQRQKNRKLRKIAPGTLYWNPSVQTDENGEAIIQFQSPADYEQVRVTAETLSPQGRPGAAHMVLTQSD